MKNQSKAPKLRFPEFSDYWESKTFDDIAAITRLAGYEYSEYWEEDINQEIIALRGYNIGKGFLELNNLGYISNKLSLKLGRSRLFKGDIVYPCVGTIGNAVVIEENDKYHIQQNIAKISPKENVSPFFISQFLMSDRGLNEVYRFNATTSQPNVLVGSLRKFEIQIPNVQEQNKISSFFTLLDQYLLSIKKKKSLLEQYKKGIMHQLFSHEMRFKDEDGIDYEDWEEMKLEKICEFYRGSPISKSDFDQNGKFQCIHYGELFTKYNEVIRSIYSRTNLENGFFSRIGDILMPSSDVTPDGLAKASSIQIEGVVLGGDMNILRPNSHFNSIYLSYLLNFNKIKIMQIVSGTTIKHIYNKDVKSLVLLISKSLPEQQKIASFLSALDDKIAQTALQIEKMQLWKKGLLQQMFV